MVKLSIFCALLCLATLSTASEQQKNIIQLLNDEQQGDQPLKAEAQTYSASISDPSGGHQAYASSGYSRTADTRSSQRFSSSSSSNAEADEEAKKLAEEEDDDDRKPDRLALLLAESKFTCEGAKNGYYADETVGCQIFHYCVEGVKHSWQCPENTVFHQIHLNCVPNTQDICQQSSKYHIVNEYLHKELEERGPNNTVLYHQRFYPDGFDYSGGDPVAQIFQAQAQAALQKAQQAQRRPQPAADDDDEEPEAPVRGRPRTRPQSQQDRAPSPKPQSSYRQQQNRPSLLSNYAPAQPSKPTSRPLFTSSPETFSPPAYTERPQDDYGNTDFTDHRSSSGFEGSTSLSSPNSFSASSFRSPSSSSSQSFQASGSPSSSSFSTSTGSVNSYQSTGSSSSSSSFSPSTSNQGSFRSTSRGSGSSSGNYPTRSLGIPIASFRVAPSSSVTDDTSVPSAQASSINQVQILPSIFTEIDDDGGSNFFY